MEKTVLSPIGLGSKKSQFINGCAFLLSSSSYLVISLFMTAGITFEVTEITPWPPYLWTES
jgi:hypothetical protein